MYVRHIKFFKVLEYFFASLQEFPVFLQRTQNHMILQAKKKYNKHTVKNERGPRGPTLRRHASGARFRKRTRTSIVLQPAIYVPRDTSSSATPQLSELNPRVCSDSIRCVRRRTLSCVSAASASCVLYTSTSVTGSSRQRRGSPEKGTKIGRASCRERWWIW